MRTRSLQHQMTAGRFTLPIVMFICLVLWLVASLLMPALPQKPTAYPLWRAVQEWGIPIWGMRAASFVLYAVIGYFLIEINNTFALIRMRASVQTSIYFLLIAACPGLHLIYAGDLASMFLLMSIYFLFKSYQRNRSSRNLFLSFSCLATAALLFPQLAFLFPLWLAEAYNFQALNKRSFWASLLGYAMPYWFLWTVAYRYGRVEWFYTPFRELAAVYPVADTGGMRAWELYTVGYLLVLGVVSAVHCLKSSYKDKIRTRAYLLFLILLCSALFLLLFVQPAHSINLLPILISVLCILLGHLFVLTDNRASNVLFIGFIVGLIFLFGCSLWTLL